MDLDAERNKLQARNILFIRHGTTKWNMEKRYLGHTDIGLLPNAEKELAPLRDQLIRYSWDAVYCSDLLRCKQTLLEVVENVSVQTTFDPRLRETHFGQWEGMTYEQLKANPVYRDWIDAPQDITPPDGESWQVFTARIDSFLQECVWSNSQSSLPKETDERTMLVVTHGGVIRYALSRLIANRGFWDTQVVPGQLIQVRLEHKEDQWKGKQVAFPDIGL